jgi:hypothetical protein
VKSPQYGLGRRQQPPNTLKVGTTHTTIFEDEPIPIPPPIPGHMFDLGITRGVKVEFTPGMPCSIDFVGMDSLWGHSIDGQFQVVIVVDMDVTWFYCSRINLLPVPDSFA